jgi:hypothetical protein
MRVSEFRSDHRSKNSGPYYLATHRSFGAEQRWPVSKRINSSKADADDATLIEKVTLEVA